MSSAEELLKNLTEAVSQAKMGRTSELRQLDELLTTSNGQTAFRVAGGLDLLTTAAQSGGTDDILRAIRLACTDSNINQCAISSPLAVTSAEALLSSTDEQTRLGVWRLLLAVNVGQSSPARRVSAC